MHILILNQTFYPDVAATGQLMWDLAQYLAARSHRVSAVTSRGFYGTDRRHSQAFERIGNIHIHRLGGTAFGKRHLIGRLTDFASFYLAAACHLVHAPAPDVILCLTSPPMISTLAMVAKQFLHTPSNRPVRFVYHIMDLYPDAIVADSLASSGGLLDRSVGRLTTRTLEVADASIVLGRDMRDRIITRYHAAASRVHVITPWADGQLLYPVAKADNSLALSLGLADTFNIVYSGNLGIAHDLQTMLQAMEIMRDDPGVQWLFIGGGKHFQRLQQHIDRSSWKHVRILPFQPRSELNRSLNLADVHLVSQLPAFTGVVVPSKLFGILAVGRPAVMVGPADAECSRILADHQCGLIAPNGQPDVLVGHLRRLIQDAALRSAMGARARAAFESNYDLPVACGRIESILKHAVER